MNTKPIIGLAGVLVAVLTAELNEQVSALALPELRAVLGIGHDGGTWITSLYITGEVVGMALGPWLALTITLRRCSLLVIAATLIVTLALSTLPGLPLFLGLRLAQGFLQGLTIPLLMTTALRVLDAPIRLYGLAAYALSATFFPALGSTVCALWTDFVGIGFAFYQDIPLCAIAAVLVWFGVPQDEPKYERFAQFDWTGALLIAFGFGSLTTFLQQGDRYDWFNAPPMSVLAAVSAVAIPALLFNETRVKHPLLKLSLLTNRNFAFGVIGLFVFLLIGLSSSQIPQLYLQEVQGYRPLQSSVLTLEIAAIQLVMLPAMAMLLNFEFIDARWVSAAGLLLILVACMGGSGLVGSWTRGQFLGLEALQAVGQPMVVMSLLMLGTNAVEAQDGPFAAALINIPRALAEASGACVLDLIVRFRGALHTDRLEDTAGLHRFALLQHHGLPPGPVPPLAAAVASQGSGSLAAFAGRLSSQSTVMSISDAFLLIATIVLGFLALLAILPVRSPPPRIALAKS